MATPLEQYMPNWLVDPMLRGQMEGTFGTGVGPQWSTLSSYQDARNQWANEQFDSNYSMRKNIWNLGHTSSSFKPDKYIKWNAGTGKFKRGGAGSDKSSLKKAGKFQQTLARVKELNKRMEDSEWGKGDISGRHVDYLQEQGGTSYNPFDAESLTAGRKSFAGVGEAESEGRQSLSTELFKRMRPGYYAGEVAEERGGLLGKLAGRLSTAGHIGGGFAGYGARGVAKDVSRDIYRGGVEDIYGDVEEQTTGALGEFYDLLEDYRGIGS